MVCDSAGDSLFPFLSAILVDTSTHPCVDVYVRVISFIQQSIPFLQALWSWMVLHTKHRLRRKRKKLLNICALLFFSVGLRQVVSAVTRPQAGGRFVPKSDQEDKANKGPALHWKRANIDRQTSFPAQFWWNSWLLAVRGHKCRPITRSTSQPIVFKRWKSLFSCPDTTTTPKFLKLISSIWLPTVSNVLLLLFEVERQPYLQCIRGAIYVDDDSHSRT